MISRLLRLGMLAILLGAIWLVGLGVDLCADYVKQWAANQSIQREDTQIQPAQSQINETEEAGVFAGISVSGVVTVDPGHGGVDPGCGEEGTPEKEIALDISLMLRDMLEQAGVTVVMTRQKDESVSLDRRAIIANDASSDLFVSIHCNSYEGEARGMDCYYYKSEQAKELAQSILDEASSVGVNTRQIQKNNYQVLWDTDMPAVLVETGFLTDAEEAELLSDPDYQYSVAQAVAAAVIKALQTDLI